MKRSACALVVALFFVLASAPRAIAGAPAPSHGTITLDVVALADGAQVPGVEANSVVHEGYTYLFADARNADAFRADPAPFKVGVDGMCAKMGPLAGRGSTEIIAIYKGRLFLCASESCKATFLEAPEKHIDADDPAPTPDKQNVTPGRERIARAIAAHFGPAGIDAVRVFEQEFAEDIKQGDTPYHHVETLVIGADGSVRAEEAWNDSVYAFVATPTDAWVETSGEPTEPLYADARRELERRTRDVHWVSVLRAASQPDAVVFALPAAKLMGGPEWVERVVVSHNGVTCVLGLEQATGKVRTIDFISRGQNHRFGMRTRVFEAYDTIDGVLVPTAWSDHSSGEKIGVRSGVVVRLNGAVQADPFTRPAN